MLRTYKYLKQRKVTPYGGTRHFPAHEDKLPVDGRMSCRRLDEPPTSGVSRSGMLLGHNLALELVTHTWGAAL